MRQQALTSPREKLGIPPAATPATPWGVVMDWGIVNGTATVLAFSDGSASVYLSSGGGYIGGQPKEAINKAAKEATALAAECQAQAHRTTNFPLPQTHQVIFYLLTDQGVVTATSTEQELQGSSRSLAKLGNAMQNVITQYRLLNDKK